MYVHVQYVLREPTSSTSVGSSLGTSPGCQNSGMPEKLLTHVRHREESTACPILRRIKKKALCAYDLHEDAEEEDDDPMAEMRCEKRHILGHSLRRCSYEDVEAEELSFLENTQQCGDCFKENQRRMQTTRGSLMQFDIEHPTGDLKICVVLREYREEERKKRKTTSKSQKKQTVQ